MPKQSIDFLSNSSLLLSFEFKVDVASSRLFCEELSGWNLLLHGINKV